MVYFQIWLTCVTAASEFQFTSLHVFSIFMLLPIRHPVETEKKEEKIIPSRLPLWRAALRSFYCTDPYTVNHHSSRLLWLEISPWFFLACQLTETTLQRERCCCYLLIRELSKHQEQISPTQTPLLSSVFVQVSPIRAEFVLQKMSRPTCWSKLKSWFGISQGHL